MKTKSFLLAAACLMGMSACTSDEIKMPANGDEPVVVKFSTPTATTRLSEAGTKWDQGDEIGIFMVKHGTTTLTDENVLNFKYVIKELAAANVEAGFDPAGNDIAYYPVDGTYVDFIAYSPYNFNGNTITSLGKYPVNVGGTQATQEPYDLLYVNSGKDETGYNKEYTGSIPLTFAHQLVKLVITVKGSAGVDISKLTKVSINGLNTKADFNLANGTLDNITTPASIIPTQITKLTATTDWVYEAILLPTAATGITAATEVIFTVDGADYTWELIDNFATTGFIKNSLYNYTVTISKTGLGGTGSAATGTIGAWSNYSGNGTAY
ncbi:MAG: fimbrillin family protein [Prevotellaceae bacterium]|jgi:hypothetical protein|nr:fimbrillin family protein [Prevotellaceae bacterium]